MAEPVGPLHSNPPPSFSFFHLFRVFRGSHNLLSRERLRGLRPNANGDLQTVAKARLLADVRHRSSRPSETENSLGPNVLVSRASSGSFPSGNTRGESARSEPLANQTQTQEASNKFFVIMFYLLPERHFTEVCKYSEC